MENCKITMLSAKIPGQQRVILIVDDDDLMTKRTPSSLTQSLKSLCGDGMNIFRFICSTHVGGLKFDDDDDL